MEEEAGAITVPGQTVIKVGASRSQSKTPAGSPWTSAWETLSFTDPRAGSRDTEGGAGDHFSLSGFPVCAMTPAPSFLL